MTRPGSDVRILVVTSQRVDFDAVERHFAASEVVDDEAGATFVVGTLLNTGVQLVLCPPHTGVDPQALLTHRAITRFQPNAILSVGLAASHASVAQAGDVVVGIGSTQKFFGSMLMLARDLARTEWWRNGAAFPEPGRVHFRPVVSSALDPQPDDSDVVLAANSDVMAVQHALRALGLPFLPIYGVSDVLGAGPGGAAGSKMVAARNAALFAVSFAAFFERASNSVVHHLVSMGHGDRIARTDLLARHAFVESLAELLSRSAPPDADEDLAGPTVIAIEGAWGSGKSTLMDMTRTRLDTAGPVPARRGPWAKQVARWRERKLRAWDADLTLNGRSTRRKRKNVEAPKVLTAMFNPWSCQTSEHVWAGLNDCIVSTGAPVIATNSGSSLQRFWFAHNVEQLDRSHVQRTLRKRIVSPSLRLGVFALPVPLLAQLVRAPAPFNVLGFDVAPADLTLWVVGLMLGIGLAHTAVRYLVRAADTLLPAELFGPSGAMGAYSTAVGMDDPLRDPHRRTRKGQLHSAQEDVHRLIRELGEQGTQLVVFIDDLDRCSPRTTADVFEAINGFLSGSFPSIRFVLGIDAAATAAHLDAAYSALVVADAGRDSADPSPGWTFLRKLIQLPLPLPRVAQTQVEPLLTGLLGTPPAEDDLVITPEEVARLTPFVPGKAPADVAGAEVIHTLPAVVALEHDAKVKERFAERLRAQPDLSVREAKRILTVWMFYVRVLDRLDPETGPEAVRRACHLVLLAEIVARWPASQRCLHRRVDGVHGLRALAGSVDDTVQWEIEVRKYELHGDRHRSFRKGVQQILKDYDGVRIAGLAEQLT
ncbi:P-loop NTPase fold protein [Lentzea sp. HUAS TT2]|uniref:P-loop NTPase fold protein n=1 Tax=Lentzea sp. HUAS TT2 TaxID=3447454 RepID=UPI003F6F1D2D